MDEAAAKRYLEDLDVSRETLGKLERYVALLLTANRRQNLIGAGTIHDVWARHIVDSAQILRHAPTSERIWLDVGSGAGLPGLVLSFFTLDRHTLVEPRKLRATFLRDVVQELGLAKRVTVRQSPVSALTGAAFTVITARALKRLTQTLAMTFQLSSPFTVWLLHKGISAAAEIDEALVDWNGSFERLPSVTDRAASIVRVRDLRAAAL